MFLQNGLIIQWCDTVNFFTSSEGEERTSKYLRTSKGSTCRRKFGRTLREKELK
jgi:hypothetical protein